jgi:hypothetical protein
MRRCYCDWESKAIVSDDEEGSELGALDVGAPGRSPRQRIILFDYDASRSSEVAMRLLEGTHGVIQSDGYSAYDQVARHYGLVH